MDIEQIKADMAAGTPTLGGWGWYGGRDEVYLATHRGGRQFVMDFARKGMSSAQPRFQTKGAMYGAVDCLTSYQVGDGTARGQKQADADPSVYRMDVLDIDHPDARRIARVPDLEAEVLRLTALVEAADALADEGERQFRTLISWLHKPNAKKAMNSLEADEKYLSSLAAYRALRNPAP